MKLVDSLSIEPLLINSGGAKNVLARVLISKADGAPNFSMRMFELGEDGHTFKHTHNYEHVVYVLAGKGLLFFEGNDYELDEGKALLVPPNLLHQFRNTGRDPLRILCLVPNGDDVPDKLK